MVRPSNLCRLLPIAFLLAACDSGKGPLTGIDVRPEAHGATVCSEIQIPGYQQGFRVRVSQEGMAAIQRAFLRDGRMKSMPTGVCDDETLQAIRDDQKRPVNERILVIEPKNGLIFIYLFAPEEVNPSQLKGPARPKAHPPGYRV